MKTWIAIIAVSIVTLILGMASALPDDAESTVNADGSATIKITAAQASACVQGGGCIIIPRNTLEAGIKALILRACGKES